MASSSQADALSAGLEAALLRRLADDWDNTNWSLFGDAMRRPLFELADGTAYLAMWKLDRRTIVFSRAAILGKPWAQVIEVLKHEMAHQFVDEVLGGEEKPHGPAFRRVCAERGIDGAAAGLLPLPEDEDDRPEDRAIGRVKKLLALAQSSNRNEAELAAATAQRIMIKYNLELPQEGRSLDDSAGTDPTYGATWVGTPTGRVQAHHRALVLLLTEHFFVDGLWIPVYRPREGKPGQVFELCGRRENLQMAEYVYDFLEQTIERLWKAHKKARGIRSDKDRRTFLVGAIAGFDKKLRDQRNQLRNQSQAEGLVLARDPLVDQFLRRRNPRIRTVRGAGVRRTETYEAGESAGRSIVLSRPITAQSETRGPRALKPGKG